MGRWAACLDLIVLLFPTLHGHDYWIGIHRDEKDDYDHPFQSGIPSGKRSHNYGQFTPFSSWVNPLFRLGHGFQFANCMLVPYRCSSPPIAKQEVSASHMFAGGLSAD